MKIYYIANARMPTEKAHGIQTAKMCEAFIEAGVDLTLVVPRRTTDPRSLKDYYGLRVHVPIIRVPAIDWYTGGRIGYFISSASFMVSYLFFIWRKKMSGEHFILYTIDTDNYSSSALAFSGAHLFSEMHGAKPRTIAQRILFNKMGGVIAINNIIVNELKESFPSSTARYLVEPNCVDASVFTAISKKDARMRLSLPPDVPIVLYAGRFFEWKGLEILPKAASETPSVRWQTVGGDREHFASLVLEPLPNNLFFAGSRPYNEMPLWLAAANVLLVLGTVRDRQSYRYTSPMKLFEYLVAERAIVASSTPAIREIVTEKEVFFYKPDDAQDLIRAVMSAIDDSSRVSAAKQLSTAFTWSARAKRIIEFIKETYA